MRRLILRTACLPADALGLLAALLLACVSGWGDWSVRKGCVLWWPSRRSWLATHWPYSMAFGHVLVLLPRHGSRTVRHEMRHARQSEIAAVLWASMTLATWSPVMLALSPLSWVAFYWAAACASWLGGDRAYYDNVLEEDARAEAGP